jgi:hypothetical protein
MTEAELAQEIVTACTDLDGFLVSLRTTNTFNESHYDYLIDLLHNYQAILGESRMMDRRVAGCLLELEMQLFIQIEQRQDAPYLTPVKQQLDYAFRDITDLNAAIFWK